MLDPDTCLICKEQLQSEPAQQPELRVLTVKHKAINAIIKISTEKNDGLSESLSGISEIKLHSDCLKEYRKTQLQLPEKSNQDGFAFEKLCFICGKDADLSRFIKNRVSVVERPTTKLTILGCAEANPSPHLKIVVDRIKDVELEKLGRYHKSCYGDVTNRERPGRNPDPAPRKITTAMQYAFDYMDSTGDSYFFLKEIDTVIGDNCEYVPDRRTIKLKLKERYKNAVSFNKTPGKHTLITLKDPSEVSQGEQYWNSQEERLKIVKKAVKILRFHVFKVEPKLPDSLNALIEILATEDKSESKKRKISESIAVYIKNC